MICLVYTEGCLFFGPTQNALDAVFDKMRAADLDFQLKKQCLSDSAPGLLITPDENGTVEITHMGLIDCIIAAMG